MGFIKRGFVKIINERKIEREKIRNKRREEKEFNNKCKAVFKEYDGGRGNKSREEWNQLKKEVKSLEKESIKRYKIKSKEIKKEARRRYWHTLKYGG